MQDLFLTPRGDLSIETVNDSKQRLEINFLITNSNALTLNFFIEDTFEKQENNNSLVLLFKPEQIKNDKELRTISGDIAIEQAIKIRLATSLGSLTANKDIGSKLETIIHQFIDKDSTVAILEKEIKNAIKDIVSNPIIKMNKIKTKYTDYSQGLKIIIVDGDKSYTVRL